jgi:hypothetical protein
VDLKDAAKDFLTNADSARLADDLTQSEAERSALCREAQNTLRAAVESADSAVLTGAVMNRLSKTSEGKTRSRHQQISFAFQIGTSSS